MSISPKAAIQKGKDLENYVAEQIRGKGLDPKAVRAHGSGNGNTEKADIWTSLQVLGQNIGIECKHYGSLAIQEWWRQTKKLEKLGREPVLIFKQTQDQYADTRVVIYLDTFLELVKASTSVEHIEVVGVNIDTREQKHALDNLKIALNRAIKVLE